MTPHTSFVLDWVRVTGGLWEEEEPGFYRVVPAAVPEGMRGLGVLTDDPEVLRESAEASLVAPGSAVFEGALEDAFRRGRLGLCHLVGLPSPEARVLAAIRAGLRLGGASFHPDRVVAMEHRSGIFSFVATFEADDVRRETIDACVNLNNGRVARRVPAAAARAARSEPSVDPLPQAPVISSLRAYGAARTEAGSKVDLLRQAHAAELERRRKQEGSRAIRYYDDLLRELEEDRSRRRDESRARVLEARWASIVAERERMLSEIDGRHRLKENLWLASILVFAQPKVVLEGMVVNKTGGRTPLRLVWDPLLGELEPIECPTCRSPGYAFELTWKGIRCPREGARVE